MERHESSFWASCLITWGVSILAVYLLRYGFGIFSLVSWLSNASGAERGAYFREEFVYIAIIGLMIAFMAKWIKSATRRNGGNDPNDPYDGDYYGGAGYPGE